MAKTKKAAFSRTSKNIPGHLKHSQICQEFPVVTMMFKKGIHLHIQIKLVDDEPVRNLLDKATNPHKFLGKTSFHLYH